MAHNTRPLKRAQDGVAPQYYNPTTDEYEALHGTAGANHVVIYGPDGQPASLATEAKLEAVRALLALLEGKDFATDTKAEAIRLLLASLDGKNFASETTLAALGTELELLKAELADVKTMLTDGTAKGEVTLSGTKEVIRSFNHSVTEEYHQFGDVVTGSANGVNLDVRNFSEIEIRIRNRATRDGVDVPLRNYQLAVYLEKRQDIRLPTNSVGSIYSKVGPEIPAGATVWLTREQEPILAQPRCLYVIVRTSCGGTGEPYGGSIEVDFIGKR